MSYLFTLFRESHVYKKCWSYYICMTLYTYVYALVGKKHKFNLRREKEIAWISSITDHEYNS